MDNYEDKSRQELALQRTDWAAQRTLLANERNFSAWMRTGLAALATGLGIGKLLGSMGAPTLTRLIGVSCIMVSAVVFVLALWRYKKVYDALNREGIQATPMWIIHFVIAGMLLSDIVAMILLFTIADKY